nr:hypothetical protein JVH1_4294 [Rhodococcus sp. JVH1]
MRSTRGSRMSPSPMWYWLGDHYWYTVYPLITIFGPIFG